MKTEPIVQNENQFTSTEESEVTLKRKSTNTFDLNEETETGIYYKFYIDKSIFEEQFEDESIREELLNNLKDLKKHRLIEHFVNEKKVYKCSECTFRSDAMYNARRHLLRHFGIPKNRCLKLIKAIQYQKKGENRILEALEIGKDLEFVGGFKKKAKIAMMGLENVTGRYNMKCVIKEEELMKMEEDFSDVYYEKFEAVKEELRKLGEFPIEVAEYHHMMMFSCGRCDFKNRGSNYQIRRHILHKHMSFSKRLVNDLLLITRSEIENKV